MGNCNNTHIACLFLFYYYYQWLIFLILNCDFTRTSRVNNCNSFVSINWHTCLSLIKLVILQVILLILEKRYSFHNRYSKIHKNHFHVSLWEQRKYLEDVTQDSVKKERNYRYHTNVCYGHPFRYYLNSYLYFLDSFIQNPFHLF
jgi:hypothetical protein